MTDLELRARDLLRRFPLVDGHNDLPWALRARSPDALADVNLAAPVTGTHTDLPRLAAGGVGAQFWSVYMPASLAGDSAVAAVLEQIDLARRMIARYPQALELALTAGDVQRIFASGRVASLLGAEGGHAIAGSLGVLRMLYALGVRYLTLTHNSNVGWADSATDEPQAGGLTEFGRDVVREMQRIGMLVDLSHTSPDTMRDALDAAAAPVIFSHSSARAVCDTPRNVPDDVLARLAGNGGVCMVTFVPGFVSQQCADWLAGLKAEASRRGLDPRDFDQLDGLRAEWEAAHPPPRATLAQVAGHIEHVRQVAGVPHVGIGGDFDGTPDVTVGLEDVSTYPALFAELLARGWSESDSAAVAGGNLLRVLREAESFAARAVLTGPGRAERGQGVGVGPDVGVAGQRALGHEPKADRQQQLRHRVRLNPGGYHPVGLPPLDDRHARFPEAPQAGPQDGLEFRVGLRVAPAVQRGRHPVNAGCGAHPAPGVVDPGGQQFLDQPGRDTCGRVDQDRRHGPADLAGGGGDGGPDDLVLSLEVAVDGPGGHAGPGDDHLHRHRLQPVLKQAGPGGVQDLLPPGLPAFFSDSRHVGQAYHKKKEHSLSTRAQSGRESGCIASCARGAARLVS